MIALWRVTNPMRSAHLAATCLLLVACGKKSVDGAKAYDTPITEKPLPEEGLVLQEIDLDGDEMPEIFNYLRERTDAPRLLVRKEMDLNRDGKVDVISWFDETGRLEREEMDGDHDGTIDHVDHYQDGKRVMSQYDTDYDGVANVHKYYVRTEEGSMLLDRKERDTDGDGHIDVWERFDPKGEVIRTGRDTDGDGKMDVREE